MKETVIPESDSSRGLGGVTAVRSAITLIGDSSLSYRGYDVDDLAAHSTFEEVSYLLWHGQLPAKEELSAFVHALRSERGISPEIAALIGSFPPTADAMSSLRTSVSALALYDLCSGDPSPVADPSEAVSILGKVPTMVASIYRASRSLRPVPPDPSLGEAANFLAMIHGGPASALQARVFEQTMILHADHELNASTFAARIAASTKADLCCAVVAALSTLAGPLHGGAAATVQQMLRDVGDESNVTAYLDATLQVRPSLAGFGHRVYVTGDPRAKLLQALSAELAAETGVARWYDISRGLHAQMVERTNLHPNVDFYSASVYTYLGLPSSLFASLFALGRLSGWIAHILEQYHNNRLIRPRAEYNGFGPRTYMPPHER